MIYSVSIKTNSKGFEIYDIYIYIYMWVEPLRSI